MGDPAGGGGASIRIAFCTMALLEPAAAWDAARHLVAAYLLALPLGLERGRAARRAGLRTFPLVAVGSCAFVLLGGAALDGSPEAHARRVQGVITGIAAARS